MVSKQWPKYKRKYSNQLGKIDALIIGMGGLGVEIAKNIILAGPKSVTIYDRIIFFNKKRKYQPKEIWEAIFL